jgi:hypothetical protein
LWLTLCAARFARAGFGHGEVALNAEKTKEVIAETNGFYKKLIAGEAEAGKLWIPGKD